MQETHSRVFPTFSIAIVAFVVATISDVAMDPAGYTEQDQKLQIFISLKSDKSFLTLVPIYVNKSVPLCLLEMPLWL